MGAQAIGVDIGGTNSSYGLVDRGGRVLQRGSRPTDRGDPRATVDGLCRALSAIAPRDLAGIGVGAPNGNYYRGTVELAPNLDWPDRVQLDEMFRAHFDVPVFVTNDANAAALGEWRFGAARGLRDFLVVTLGTGLGSGFVSGGRLVYGHDGFAGELGHTTVVPDGRPCGCGRRGCLETYASATGIVTTMRELRPEDSRPLTAEEISAAAAADDALALRAFDETARMLARGLATAVAVTSPEKIVLLGGLARAGELLLAPTRRHLEVELYPVFRGKVELTLSGLDDDDAAILGAAALLWSEVGD